MMGSPSRTCQADKQWSGEVTFCKGKDKTMICCRLPDFRETHSARKSTTKKLVHRNERHRRFFKVENQILDRH